MMLFLASQENARRMDIEERRKEREADLEERRKDREVKKIIFLCYSISNILLYFFIQASRILEMERLDASKQSDRLFLTMMLTAMEKRS